VSCRPRLFSRESIDLTLEVRLEAKVHGGCWGSGQFSSPFSASILSQGVGEPSFGWESALAMAIFNPAVRESHFLSYAGEEWCLKGPMKAAPARVIRNSDVLVDSSVFGEAALSRESYDRLALLAHKLTARPEFGKLWIPWTALQEMVATPVSRRSDVLGVVLNLHRELGDRIVFTEELKGVVAGEWATPPRFVYASVGQLEDELLACIRGNGAGTQLDAMGRDFAKWRVKLRARYDESLTKWAKQYKADKRMRDAIELALNKARSPADLYEFCDDLAVQLIRDYAERDPVEGLKLAKAEPEKYIATWTFSLLVRVAQFAQTIPPKERSTAPFGAYAKLLKSNENDVIDATLAALGARCGFLISQDGGLRERINFLFARNVCRLQAFDFSDIETNWHPPGI
jgi:hypothetical protein